MGLCIDETIFFHTNSETFVFWGNFGKTKFTKILMWQEPMVFEIFEKKIFFFVNFSPFLFGVVSGTPDFSEVVQFFGGTWDDINILASHIHIYISTVYQRKVYTDGISQLSFRKKVLI